MELAALLAVGLGDWIDFGVIIGILCLNAFVGFYQEKQAADVVASLKGDIAMKAHVVRNGREEHILARELVPGDIVSVLLAQPHNTTLGSIALGTGQSSLSCVGHNSRRTDRPC